MVNRIHGQTVVAYLFFFIHWLRSETVQYCRNCNNTLNDTVKACTVKVTPITGSFKNVGVNKKISFTNIFG